MVYIKKKYAKRKLTPKSCISKYSNVHMLTKMAQIRLDHLFRLGTSCPLYITCPKQNKKDKDFEMKLSKQQSRHE